MKKMSLLNTQIVEILTLFCLKCIAYFYSYNYIELRNARLYPKLMYNLSTNNHIFNIILGQIKQLLNYNRIFHSGSGYETWQKPPKFNLPRLFSFPIFNAIL